MSATSESNPKMQKAQVFFKTGNDAALKSNYKYAIAMYQEACKLVPDNILYRQALRGVERRVFDNEPSKVGRLVGMKVQPILLRVRTAKAQSKWEHVLEVCEEAFVHNPWDTHVAVEFAHAAEHLDWLELARWSLESVRNQATDAEFFRYLAKVYELNEDWNKAIETWERVKKLAPNDDNARRKIQSLSASATIARSGYEEVRRDDEPIGVARNEPEKGGDDPHELKAQARSPEELLLEEVTAEPTRVGPYLALADHYRMNNRLEDAEKILARGKKAAPGDEVLARAHADIQMSRLQRAIDFQVKKLKAEPDDAEAKTKLAQFRGALETYELKEFRRRVTSHPDDPQIRLQYGMILARIGRHDEAIAEFQQARNSPNLKLQALNLAGQSFEAKGLPKLAERNYQEALKLADPDDQALLNSLHYRIGRVAEVQGELAAAEEHYNEVAANDYTYLDVAERLANLNQKPPA
jgi:tetratricopeptide (TPR) repeat protein